MMASKDIHICTVLFCVAKEEGGTKTKATNLVT